MEVLFKQSNMMQSSHPWRAVHTCRGGSQVGVGGTNRSEELRAAQGRRMIRRAACYSGAAHGPASCVLLRGGAWSGELHATQGRRTAREKRGGWKSSVPSSGRLEGRWLKS
jgi:hypothetical protein